MHEHSDASCQTADHGRSYEIILLVPYSLHCFCHEQHDECECDGEADNAAIGRYLEIIVVSLFDAERSVLRIEARERGAEGVELERG